MVIDSYSQVFTQADICDEVLNNVRLLRVWCAILAAPSPQEELTLVRYASGAESSFDSNDFAGIEAATVDEHGRLRLLLACGSLANAKLEVSIGAAGKDLPLIGQKE